MYNISDFISRPVLSLYEGELLGNVTAIHFDKKLKRILMLEVTRADNEETYILPYKNIYNVGKNAITIKNNQSLLLKDSSEPVEYVKCPIGSKAYTVGGELLGVISSLEFNEKFEIISVKLENEKEIDISKLASCSNNTVLVYDEKNTININNFKFKSIPKLFKTKKTVEVKTMPTENKTEEIKESSMPKILNVAVEMPKINTNYKYLLNKRVVKDIFGFNNELLIKNNTKITQNIINTACKNDKIKELLIFSK